MLKIKPTEQELEIIQNMINENYSFTAIGKKMNMCDKTIKKITEECDIDMSHYNKRIAAGKSKKVKLSDEDIKIIVKSLEEGISLKKIVKNFSITYPTLKRILDEKGIDYNSYKRVSDKKFKLTNLEKQEVIKDLNNNISITNISKKFNINRNTFSEYLKEEGIIKPKEININDKIKDFIIDCHKKYITINNISLITKIDKNNIKNIIRQCDVEITESIKYHKNYDGNLSNGSTNLLLRLQEFNAISDNPLINKSDIEYLIENIPKTPYIDIIKKLKKDYKELKHFAISIGYKDIFNFNSMMTYEYKDELLNDLANTCYSNSQLATKYGVGHMTISSWRKDIYGNVKTYYNSNISQSTLEIKFELILNELDIAFIREYRIEGLQYDYYLGHKLLVELQGDYWHNNKDNNDDKKLELSKEQKYVLLQISEYDINNNRNAVKENILNLYLELITKQYKLSD